MGCCLFAIWLLCRSNNNEEKIKLGVGCHVYGLPPYFFLSEALKRIGKKLIAFFLECVCPWKYDTAFSVNLFQHSLVFFNISV